MTTFRNDILLETHGEPIIGIVIGDMGLGDGYKKEGKPKWSHVENKLISWEIAAPLLDYEYDSGYGTPDCQAIVAWTQNWILFVTQYDGSTEVCSIPRNPIDCKPDMPGE
jgi:hypothetical protein